MAAKQNQAWVKDIRGGEWGHDKTKKVIIYINTKTGNIIQELPVGPQFNQHDLKLFVKREDERYVRSKWKKTG